MNKFLWALRFSPARGPYWNRERNVTSETASQWLAIYQRDEPTVEFRVANREPRIPLP